MKRIAVFCGSNKGARADYAQALKGSAPSWPGAASYWFMAAGAWA